MIPPVFAILSATTAVTALLGSAPCRVYPYGAATQQPTYPYATWTIISGSPENLITGAPGIDQMSVQVDIWARTDASARAVMVAVRDALEPVSTMTRFGSTERESATEAYRYSMDFDFWVDR